MKWNFWPSSLFGTFLGSCLHISFRKLVFLKLEKGYEYGDAILGGTIPHFPNYQKELRISLVDEMKEKGKKSIKIVCQEGSVAEQYTGTPGYSVEEDLVRVPGDYKAAVERGCQVCKRCGSYKGTLGCINSCLVGGGIQWVGFQQSWVCLLYSLSLYLINFVW